MSQPIEGAPHLSQLRHGSRGVFVHPWMVAELGIAGVWFAQLLWRLDQAEAVTLVAADHEWEGDTGLTRTQVQRARTKVGEVGWIRCKVRKVAGAPTTHIVLEVDALEGYLRAMHCAEPSKPGSRDGARTSSLATDPEQKTASDRAQPALIEPDAEEPPWSVASLAEAWREWWAVYPRKTAKPAAERAYVKAMQRVEYDAELLLAAARRWREAHARADPKRRKFTPHPATWLNGDRWNDDPFDHFDVGAAGPHGRISQDRDRPSGRIDL